MGWAAGSRRPVGSPRTPGGSAPPPPASWGAWSRAAGAVEFGFKTSPAAAASFWALQGLIFLTSQSKIEEMRMHFFALTNPSQGGQ